MYEIIYKDIEPKKEYEEIIRGVIEACYNKENLANKKLITTIILTTPEEIRKINKLYRNKDKETDVLSFPMFEKDELIKKFQEKAFKNEDILGDIIISIEKVQEQAKEYGHSFKRELSYMVVHGFYHIMGYDHIKEEDKKVMRQKEEEVLKNIAFQ